MVNFSKIFVRRCNYSFVAFWIHLVCKTDKFHWEKKTKKWSWLKSRFFNLHFITRYLPACTKIRLLLNECYYKNIVLYTLTCHHVKKFTLFICQLSACAHRSIINIQRDVNVLFSILSSCTQIKDICMENFGIYYLQICMFFICLEYI